jgi:hypothetical protein
MRRFRNISIYDLPPRFNQLDAGISAGGTERTANPAQTNGGFWDAILGILE